MKPTFQESMAAVLRFLFVIYKSCLIIVNTYEQARISDQPTSPVVRNLANKKGDHIMPKVTINDSQGLVQSSGSGVEFNSSVSINSPVSMTSLPTTAVSAKTAAETLVSPGAYTVSGSSALTMIMPQASSVPGGTFVFRTASAHAHILTGSQESSGTKVFAGMPGATPDAQGSKLTLSAVQGSSVALISDGASFLLMAASGSHTISGT
jgi:hypothetical protein